jgi:hypothetical protein
VHLGCLAANVQRGSIAALKRFGVGVYVALVLVPIAAAGTVSLAVVVPTHSPYFPAGTAVLLGAEAVDAAKKGPDETLSCSAEVVAFVVPVA